MPELPGELQGSPFTSYVGTDMWTVEVERARKLIHDSCRGYKIKSVNAKEDKIVYTGGTTHETFVRDVRVAVVQEGPRWKLD